MPNICDELSTVCRGYKNRVVQQATLNVCAAALVNVSSTLPRAEETANELSLRLKEAMLKQAESAVLQLKRAQSSGKRGG